MLKKTKQKNAPSSPPVEWSAEVKKEPTEPAVLPFFRIVSQLLPTLFLFIPLVFVGRGVLRRTLIGRGRPAVVSLRRCKRGAAFGFGRLMHFLLKVLKFARLDFSSFFFQVGPLQSLFPFCLFESLVFSAPSLHPQSVRAIPSPTDVPTLTPTAWRTAFLEAFVCRALGRGGFSPCACFGVFVFFFSVSKLENSLRPSASAPASAHVGAGRRVFPRCAWGSGDLFDDVANATRWLVKVFPSKGGTCQSGGGTVRSARRLSLHWF